MIKLFLIPLYVWSYSSIHGLQAFSCKENKKIAIEAIEEYKKVGINFEIVFNCKRGFYHRYPRWNKEWEIYWKLMKQTKNVKYTHLMLPPMALRLNLSTAGIGRIKDNTSICFNSKRKGTAYAKWCMVHEIGHNLGLFHDDRGSCTVMDTELMFCPLDKALNLEWSDNSLSNLPII